MPETQLTFAEIRTPSSYPGSAKRYFHGSSPGVEVPYRQLSLSDTRHSDRTEPNAPLPLYDTSGPYTDPEAEIDLARGLSPQLSLIHI